MTTDDKVLAEFVALKGQKPHALSYESDLWKSQLEGYRLGRADQRKPVVGHLIAEHHYDKDDLEDWAAVELIVPVCEKYPRGKARIHAFDTYQQALAFIESCRPKPVSAPVEDEELLTAMCDAFEAADCPADRGRFNLEEKISAAIRVYEACRARMVPQMEKVGNVSHGRGLWGPKVFEGCAIISDEDAKDYVPECITELYAAAPQPKGEK